METRTKLQARPRPAREAWDLIRELVFAQRPRFVAACREFELTPPQMIALQQLKRDHAKPMSELAKLLACDASNVTGITDRLEERGLVERRNSPGDRRVKMLALTLAGEKLRAEVDRIHGEPPPELEALPAADQLALRDLLRRALADR